MKPVPLLLALFAPSLQAQDDLDALRAEVTAAALTRAEREDLLQTLDETEGFRRLAAEERARAAGFRRLTEQVPEDLKRLRNELTAPDDPPPPEPPEEPSVAELESREREARALVEEARAQLDALAAEAEKREAARQEIPERLARLATREAELTEELAGDALEELAARVQRAETRTSLAALQAEHERLEAELRSYDARGELLPLRRQRWERRLRLRERDLAVWTRRLVRAREGEARQARERAADLAREEAAQHPDVRELIEETRDLLSRRAGIADQLARARAERSEAASRLRELGARAESLRDKLAVIGLSDAVGRLLREQHDVLTPTRALSRTREELRRAWAEAEFLRLQLEDQDRAFDPKERIPALVEAAAAGRDVEAVRAVVQEAVNGYEEQLTDLLGQTRELAAARLAQLESHDALTALVEEHRAFVEANVLYVRSVEGARLPRPSDAMGAARWLLFEPSWPTALERALRAIGRAPLGHLGLVLSILVFVGLRRRIRAGLRSWGAQARSYRTDRLSLTLRALLATVALAAPVPLLLAWAGATLAAPAEQLEVAASLGDALLRTAGALFPLYFLRALCHSEGLAEAHLRWSRKGCRSVRREMRWFLPLVVVLVPLTVVFPQGAEAFDDSLGRAATWLALLAGASFAHRLLGPRRPLLRDWLRRSGGIVARTHRLWFPLLVGAPLALVVVSAFGYHYTALQFADAVWRSLVLVLVLVVLRSLLSRWQYVVRRRLAVDQARTRAQERAAAGPEGEPLPAAVVEDEDEVDIPAMNAQTRRLFDSLTAVGLGVGLYLSWAGTLPALSVLDRLQIWPSLEVLDPTATSAEASPSPATAGGGAAAVPESEGTGAATAPPVTPASVLSAARTTGESNGPSGFTLADLLLALALFGGTLLLTHNVPGLLEFTVLVYLPLDAGARYAITTIVRYVILMIGLTLSMGAVGIGWTTVQWLAAALTFGLAFGLQEIFANFVSGIILLLERPLRVGDYVTVDGVEGQVTRLRMRATTITDWDNRELLVPNKQFITSSLVNWTLSDSVTRVVVPVGIAYGSDVRRATQLLLEVARESPHVMDDPAPSVIFRSFGDSSLSLDLRVYIPHRQHWPVTVTALHQGIDDAFRAAGVEIAFPQRDLHLRSVDPEAARGLGRRDDE